MGIKNAGKNNFIWLGPKPVVNIMQPELIRDVLLKHNAFQKAPRHPLRKLLASGISSLDGEQWTKRRKIINPAFHLEKLKVIFQQENVTLIPILSLYLILEIVRAE